MRIVIEREGGSNKVTAKYDSIEELINAAVGGFVDIGEDEHINLLHVIALNVVEERPQG